MIMARTSNTLMRDLGGENVRFENCDSIELVNSAAQPTICTA